MFSRGSSDEEPLPYSQASVAAEAGKNLQVIFLNPLLMHLLAAEKQKGSPLSKEEVFAIRNKALCLVLPKDKAEVFRATLGEQFDTPQMNPKRCWTEWQQLREEFQLE